MIIFKDIFKEGDLVCLADNLEDNINLQTTINKNKSVQTQLIQRSERAKQWAIRIV